MKRFKYNRRLMEESKRALRGGLYKSYGNLVEIHKSFYYLAQIEVVHSSFRFIKTAINATI